MDGVCQMINKTPRFLHYIFDKTFGILRYAVSGKNGRRPTYLGLNLYSVGYYVN